MRAGSGSQASWTLILSCIHLTLLVASAAQSWPQGVGQESEKVLEGLHSLCQQFPHLTEAVLDTDLGCTAVT